MKRVLTAATTGVAAFGIVLTAALPAAAADDETSAAAANGVSAAACVKGGGKVVDVSAKTKLCIGGKFHGHVVV